MASSCGCLRVGSAVILLLALASWTLALGGLGAINWYTCSDTDNTLTSLTDAGVKEPATVATIRLWAPAVQGVDVAVCSRIFRWEWWTLFFEFAILVSALVATAWPERLVRARFPLATLLSAASVLIMIALNINITWVWSFWDTHHLFSDWEGILKKFYLSAAALVAGWILTVIFNIIWIGFALDAEPKAADKNCDKPITGDVEAARK
eukprot:gene3238-3515_t